MGRLMNGQMNGIEGLYHNKMNIEQQILPYLDCIKKIT